MEIMIEPGRLSGSVTPPPSKSLLHRYILCASLAEGQSLIRGAALSDDINASLSCIEALGARWTLHEDKLKITGISGAFSEHFCTRFNCGESGTTLRFMIPLALALCGGGEFTGRGRLLQRPLEPYYAIFEANGVEHRLEHDLLTICGTLKAGKYRLPGNVSSQFFSGLLFALAACGGQSEILCEGELESASYADMTCAVLRSAGIRAERKNNSFFIQGGRYSAREWSCEPDWSQAAFWIAANVLGSDIALNGMNPETAQGDRCMTGIASLLSADGDRTVDMSQCPDLLPPAAIIASLRKGTCRFTGCERLRYKESDRLNAVRDVLAEVGADVEELPDGLIIRGKEELYGGTTVDCHGDHRIAMMATIAALRCTEPVMISGAECVGKSYPEFFQHFRSLGGAADAV